MVKKLLLIGLKNKTGDVTIFLKETLDFGQNSSKLISIYWKKRNVYIG